MVCRVAQFGLSQAVPQRDLSRARSGVGVHKSRIHNHNSLKMNDKSRIHNHNHNTLKMNDYMYT